MNARPDFNLIGRVALHRLPELLDRWLPGGKFYGREYTVPNPRRADRHEGNFKINVATGRWADFAADAKGGDAISLAAYLFGLKQSDAARKLADMLGVTGETRHHG